MASSSVSESETAYSAGSRRFRPTGEILLNVLIRYMAECLHWAAPAGRGTCGGTCGAGTASAAASSIIGRGRRPSQCAEPPNPRPVGPKVFGEVLLLERPGKIPQKAVLRLRNCRFPMKTAESSCFFEKAPESSLQKSRERHIMQNCVQIPTGGRNRTAGREAAGVDPPPGVPHVAPS